MSVLHGSLLEPLANIIEFVFMSLVRAHDPIIYATPNEFLLLKPQKVQQREFESVMQVNFRN
jgi:hypothetical protein